MTQPDGEADQWAKDGEICAVIALKMKSSGASDSAGRDEEGLPLEVMPDWTLEY